MQMLVILFGARLERTRLTHFRSHFYRPRAQTGFHYEIRNLADNIFREEGSEALAVRVVYMTFIVSNNFKLDKKYVFREFIY